MYIRRVEDVRRLVANCDDLGLALSAGCMLGLELGLLQGVFNFDRACVWTTAVWDIGLKPLVAFVPPQNFRRLRAN